MPSNLRSRLALFALLGAFLIPIGMSSLRGLTHVLTCEESAETPFTLTMPESGPPQVASSARIERGDRGLCGGLALNMQAGAAGEGRVKMIVTLTNNTDSPWKGTVSLNLEGVGRIPVEIGAIAPEESVSDQLFIKLGPGSHELGGSLLLGP